MSKKESFLNHPGLPTYNPKLATVYADAVDVSKPAITFDKNTDNKKLKK